MDNGSLTTTIQNNDYVKTVISLKLFETVSFSLNYFEIVLVLKKIDFFCFKLIYFIFLNCFDVLISKVNFIYIKKTTATLTNTLFLLYTGHLI